MIVAAQAVSHAPTLEQAVDTACADVRKQLGAHTPQVAVFFVTPQHAKQFASLGARLQERIGCPSVGCTTLYVMSHSGEGEDEPAFGLLAIAGDIATHAFSQTEVTANAATIGRQLGQSFAELPGAGRMLMLLPDAYVGSLAPLVQPLVSCYGPHPLIGGAPTEAGLGRTFQWGPDGKAHSGAVSGIFFRGDFEVLTAVMQGCAPVGPPMEVTEAVGPVVMELDHQPALEVFAARLPGPLREQLPRAFRTVLFAVDEGDRRLDGSSRFLARHIVGLEADRQGLVFAEPIAQGTKVRLAIREASAAREDIKRELVDLSQRLDGRTPAFGFYFNCTNRGSQLYGVKDMDASYIDGQLGRFPWLGMASNAELATVHGNTRLFAYTGVLSVVVPKS